MFGPMAASAGYRVTVEKVTKGAYRLDLHADPTDPIGAIVEERLASNRYDFVILQEQSHRPITDREAFFNGTRALAKRIVQNGAVPILYSTWGRKKGSRDFERFGLENHDAMTYRLAAAYRKIGEELGIDVAHVGLAFHEVNAKTHLELYHADCSHSSQTGSYLAALVLFCRIFGVSPEAVTYDLALEAYAVKLLRRAAAQVLTDPAIPNEYLL